MLLADSRVAPCGGQSDDRDGIKVNKARCYHSSELFF
jgi:hypothetical protein